MINKRTLIIFIGLILSAIVIVFGILLSREGSSLEDSLQVSQEETDPYNIELRNGICQILGDEVVYVSDFVDGVGYAITEDNEYFYIDDQGRVIFRDKLLINDQINDLDANYNINNYNNFIDLKLPSLKKYPSLLPKVLYNINKPEYSMIKVPYGNQVKLISLSGTALLPNLYDDINIINNELVITKSNSLYSLEDVIRKKTILSNIDNITPISGNFIINNSNEYYLVDKNGNKISNSYQSLDNYEFSDYLAGKKFDSSLFEIIDHNGEVVDNIDFYVISEITGDIVFGSDSTNKTRYYKIGEDYIIPEIDSDYYSNVSFPFYNGMAHIKYLTKIDNVVKVQSILINDKGESIIKSRDYTDISYTKHPEDNVFIVQYPDEKYYLVDRNSNQLTKKGYNFIYSFTEESIALAKDNDGLFTFLDKYGNEITSKKYQTAFDFNNGIAIVSESDNVWQLINTNGEVVSENYSYIDTNLTEYMIVEKNNSSFNYLMRNGKELSNNDFELALAMYDGIGKIYLSSNQPEYISNKALPFCK